MYTSEITYARFAQNAKNEKFPMTVVDQHVYLHIFRNHTTAVFLKKAKRAVKQGLEEANKILSQLGSGRLKTTANPKSKTPQFRSRSRSRSKSKTPNPNRLRLRS
jgi:hypothetical protein